MNTSESIQPRPEIAAFRAALPKLLEDRHENHFVVLKGAEVTYVSPTYEQALGWAYQHYQLDDEFFVKQVVAAPHVTHFRRIR